MTEEIIYHCLIVDDEPIAIRVIRNHLSAFRNLHIVGECRNAMEAFDLLSRNRVDLIFLDIQMPQVSGLDFLCNLDHPPKIIFITAYRDYAIEAFDLDVIDYLLKPVSLPRFSKAVSRFFQRMNSFSVETVLPSVHTTLPEYFFLKADKKIHKLLISDLFYFESMGDYVVAHTQTGKIITKYRISQMEELLPPSLFLRVHRGYIVSIAKIKSILPGQIEIGSRNIPIGRHYKEAIEKLVKTR